MRVGSRVGHRTLEALFNKETMVNGAQAPGMGLTATPALRSSEAEGQDTLQSADHSLGMIAYPISISFKMGGRNISGKILLNF